MLQQPKPILQLEGLAVLSLCCFAYAHIGHSWILFAAVFLVPDLAHLAYAINNITGTAAYNLLHNYLLPAALGTAAIILDHPIWLGVALIWAAHIGFDRMIGSMLRTPDGFAHAQLRRIGRPPG